MIYDEATIDFIIKKIEEMMNEEKTLMDIDYSDGKWVACLQIITMLQNMKKIKAIN